ncbi:MAG: protein kinase, partial [Gemmataceae bacterium]
MASDHTCDFQEEDDTGSTTNQFATQEHQSGGDTATPGRGMPSRVGDYEILSQLGEGGMGVVYKARHLGLKRLVALKMIRAAGASDRDRLRFQAEVEAVARLQHPGIVGIFEVGEFAGQPFCALEFVEGGSLDVRLARQALPTHKAARLMESLARAAHAVHELHLVHRDLKPANILVQGQPDDPLEHCTLKISDFGLAKMLDNEEMGVTREGSVLGTPFYMAPEQAAGRIAEIDRRADVYSLGAILYEMLTGKPPLKGDSLSETLWKVMNEEPVAPRRVGANIDRDIDIVCRKCLEKDPEQRFATARDLADELERYLNDEPILTRQAGLVERGLKWVRRRPALAAIWILGLLIAVLGSASAFAGWQWLQAEAARGQAELSRQQAEDARQEAENANAGLAQQKRLADEAKSWALKDRLSFEQALEKAREPVSRIESTVRQEFEQQRKKLLQGFYLTQIDLAHRYWQDAEVAQARRLFDSCSVERASWEYTYIDRLCHGADLPRPAVPLGAVSMAEFNHDGSRLVVVGSQGTGCWD